MAKEIERKFQLAGRQWQDLAEPVFYRQGYLSSVKERTVRVRTRGAQAFLTIKGISSGASRSEFEYEIPQADAAAMLEELCEKPLIEKNRYRVEHAGFTWEIDEFFGENEGLLLAEIELEYEDQLFETPAWIGSEVTGDPRYFNSNLVKHPYSLWKQAPPDRTYP